MTDECITIDSSEEDDVQIMDAPTTQVELESSEIKRKVTLHTIETGKSIFTALLNTCKKADPSSEMDIIVNKMWKRFHQANSSYTSSANFIELVKTLITKATKEPCSQLKAISDDLKFHTIKARSCPVGSVTTSIATISNNSEELNRKTLRTIEKLEKVVSKLEKKIAYLENQEVDLNNSSDEENSAYIQVSRYKSRICDVFKKICQLRKQDSFDNCLRGNIRFSGTKISAVNRAIEKFYNERREFPDFRDVLTIVEKANEIKNLRLAPFECQEIAVQAFKELGETLKRQRQFEFHNSLASYMDDVSYDPATQNQLLEEKLEENKRLYGNRIDEIIDKYAMKQTEDNLQPEAVFDDAASETAGEEEEVEEDEDVSSIAEVESNADDSIADEDDVSFIGNDENEDGNQNIPFESRDLRIVIPNLFEMPEWSKYQEAQRARLSILCCAGAVCQPIPGCSKDIFDDFCISCSRKEMTRSATKRRHPLSSEDSGDEDNRIKSRAIGAEDDRSASLISVDLTDDSRPTETTAGTSKSWKSPDRAVTKSEIVCSNFELEDPLGNEKVSCSRVMNGRINKSAENSAAKSDSSNSQQFVLVDVDAILSKCTTKNTKTARLKKKSDSTSVLKSSLRTEAPEVTNINLPCDEDVPVSNPVFKDQFDLLSKNGIRIVNVTSKKDLSNVPLADEMKSEISTNHVKDGSEDDKKIKSNASIIKNNSNIIDLEESSSPSKIAHTMTELGKRFEPKDFAVSSNTNQNSKPLFFRSSSYQETKKPEDNRPPWQKFSPANNKYPVTSTPKSNVPYQPKPSLRGFTPPSHHRPNFGPRIATYRGASRGPVSQPPRYGGFFAPYRNKLTTNGVPSSRDIYTGQRTALAKRTVQTTQKFVKGSSIYTQTMTVVQESVMQESVMQMPFTGGANITRNAFASNGHGNRGGRGHHRFGGGSNAGGPSRSFTPNHGGGARQNSQPQTTKKNSTKDVITLD